MVYPRTSHWFFGTEQPKVVTVEIDFGCKNSESCNHRFLENEILREVKRFQIGDMHGLCSDCKVLLGKHVTVGELAKRRMSRQPTDAVFNIKLIGNQFDDRSVQEMKKMVHFSITEGERGETSVEISRVKFFPVEIASVIFAKLRDAVLMYQFHHELKMVISVHIFFSEQQREDIVLAGKKACLTVLQLIGESTAAALLRAATKESTMVVF
ncbi:hypothetical protein QYE76_043801 [Lolium multiflorum]|uniref:Uncharacterized protein n=1 Tax=Lolium multiflorum TaxID=4521 RepID=A0AAD8WYI6_LOLMU|nr:hypothetical protein QYE76_043801 [Lolium multiflorum]